LALGLPEVVAAGIGNHSNDLLRDGIGFRFVTRFIKIKVWPMGFCPGKNSSTKAWFAITTGDFDAISSGRKSRPGRRMMGVMIQTMAPPMGRCCDKLTLLDGGEMAEMSEQLSA
jgi:hypothetical protein